MKIFITIVIIALIIGCSTTQSKKQNSYNLSNSNINYPTTDSILVGTSYEVLGTTNKFAGTSSGDEPVAIKRAPIEYTQFAQDNKIEGTVILQVEIFPDGSVGRVIVKQSLMPGPGGLDEAAVNSVKKLKYTPAKYKGKPVACWKTLPVNFSLH